MSVGESRATLVVGAGDQAGGHATFPPPPLHEGSLTIQNSAAVTVEETIVGETRTGRGILTVTGTGSSFSSGSQFVGNTFVGYYGDGVLNVLDGGTVHTGQAFVGRFGLRDQLKGVVNVDGAGSQWTTPSTMWVGFNNDPQVYSGTGLFLAEGVLNVTHGGYVNAAQLALAGRKVSKGIVYIDGPGSVICVSSVAMGRTATTTFTFGSNARLSIANEGLLDVSGEVNVYHGDLALDGGRLRASRVVLHGAQLSEPGDPFETGDVHVLLAGVGQVDADLENRGGIVSPGQTAGILRVSGDYTQAIDGSLQIELGGTDNSDPLAPQYDQLAIEGLAMLDGTLQVSLVDLGSGEFEPRLGTRSAFSRRPPGSVAISKPWTFRCCPPDSTGNSILAGSRYS